MSDIVEQTKRVAYQLSTERIQGWMNPLVIDVIEAADEITRLRAALADERKRALEEAAALCHSRANDMLLLKSTEMAIANNLSSHFMERHNWYCDLAAAIRALKEKPECYS